MLFLVVEFKYSSLNINNKAVRYQLQSKTKSVKDKINTIYLIIHG